MLAMEYRVRDKRIQGDGNPARAKLNGSRRNGFERFSLPFWRRTITRSQRLEGTGANRHPRPACSEQPY